MSVDPVEREAQLAERERRLSTRELELDELEEELLSRVCAVAEREQELEAAHELLRAAERKARADLEARRTREAVLREREEELRAREDALRDRIRELDAHIVSLRHPAGPPMQVVRHESALAGRIASITRREPELLRRVAADDSRTTGEWNVEILDRLARQRGAEHPERADEWSAYVFTLRPYADVDGRLPAYLDSVVWDVFGEEFEEARVRR